MAWGDAHAEHTARGASGARANAHHHTSGAGAHELQGDLVGDAVTDHHRHAHVTAERFEIQGLLTFGAGVVGGHHRGLHEKQIGAGFGDGFAKAQGRHGGAAHCGDAALGFDVLDPFADQAFLHRLAVDLLHQRYELVLAD